ncbi:MAG: hypothetical protein LBM07_04210 [Culturomica sp.]|nr:hypothetical protein [Culturomica sp.]
MPYMAAYGSSSEHVRKLSGCTGVWHTPDVDVFGRCMQHPYGITPQKKQMNTVLAS